MRLGVACLLVPGLLGACASPPRLVDSDPPLAAAGDPARGREVFVARDGGHCVLCHAIPGAEVAGDVGPPLAGIGARLNAGEIRFRIADISRVRSNVAMPAFHRTEGLNRVAAAYVDKPVLSGAQVEDLVAFLGTLR
jgi:sulfur-oxidizing protein SoxX